MTSLYMSTMCHVCSGLTGAISTILTHLFRCGAGGGYMLDMDIRGTEHTLINFLLFWRIRVLFWVWKSMWLWCPRSARKTAKQAHKNCQSPPTNFLIHRSQCEIDDVPRHVTWRDIASTSTTVIICIASSTIWYACTCQIHLRSQ